MRTWRGGLGCRQADNQVGSTIMKDAQVLIVGNFLSNTIGSRGVCEDLAENLRMSGWSVTTTSNKPGRISRLLDMLKTVLSRRNDYNIATIDTFSGMSFFWAEVVGLALSWLRKPFILILHGGNLPNFAQRWPRRVTRLLEAAAVVTAPSLYLLERMKPYRPDILLVQNPIDIKRYEFNLRSAPRPTLVWLRAFHDVYNAPMAIQAAARIIPEYPEFHLFMGGGDKGDGSFQQTLELARALGISSSIEFSGKIPKMDVPDWLQRGDIFINTTNVDNTPVSILEALACGLCVVSTNVGGIPYLLSDEIDGLLVPPNDPEAMASAIRRILAEPGLSVRLSENGRKLAERSDWKNVYPLWARIFESVLS